MHTIYEPCDYAGALAAWLGSAVAVLTSYYLIQVPQELLMDVRNGLFSYNSAGTCAAIAGGVFYKVTAGNTI